VLTLADDSYSVSIPTKRLYRANGQPLMPPQLAGGIPAMTQSTTNRRLLANAALTNPESVLQPDLPFPIKRVPTNRSRYGQHAPATFSSLPIHALPELLEYIESLPSSEAAGQK
jgi:hypothetical protein